MSMGQRIKRMTAVALFCAIAYVAMFIFRINVSFLTFDIKDAIIAICGLLFGPVSALCSSFTVAFLELITVSDTGIYGFLMNFISSAVFSCTAALIYKRTRRLSGAIAGICAAVAATTCVMLLFNMVITPLFMKVDRSVVIGLIPTLLLPFNLAKSIFNAAITLFLYKPVSIALKASGRNIIGYASGDGKRGEKISGESISAAEQGEKISGESMLVDERGEADTMESAHTGKMGEAEPVEFMRAGKCGEKHLGKSGRTVKQTVITAAIGIAFAVIAVIVFILVLDGDISWF